MKTVTRIIHNNNFTIKQLEVGLKKGICNGMGGKGGFSFSKFFKHIPYFDKTKQYALINDLDLIADMHDIQFYNGGNIFDFLSANYKLSKNIICLLHWTNWVGRILIFILVFGGTTLFGRKYFNWK